MPHPAALDNALLRAKFDISITAWVKWVAENGDADNFDVARAVLADTLLIDVGACVSPLPATSVPASTVREGDHPLVAEAMQILDDAHDLYSAR